MKKLLVAAAAMLMVEGVAFAGTSPQTANVNVTATVVASCSVTTGGFAFGNYDPLVANTDVTDATGITVTCTSGTAYALALGQGTYAGGGSTDDVPVRRMKDGGTNYLTYQLYSDSSGGTIWGNSATTDVERTAADAAAFDHPLYGRIAGGQSVPVGAYSDTVVATVTF